MPDLEKDLDCIVLHKLIFLIHEWALEKDPEDFIRMIESLQTWLKKLLQAEVDEFYPQHVLTALHFIHMAGRTAPSHE